MATNGNIWVALTIFATMQIWPACELLVRIRYASLHTYLVRKAAENPQDQDLRTLMVDFASTCPTEVGERLPVRAGLKEQCKSGNAQLPGTSPAQAR
jgi:tRNA(His) 5'-end guanylyltransferase